MFPLRRWHLLRHSAAFAKRHIAPFRHTSGVRRPLCTTTNTTAEDDCLHGQAPSSPGIPFRPEKLPFFTPGSSFSGFELTFLGTASQGCGRRYPSSLAVRLHGHAGAQQIWLFDAGEGALAQIQRSHLKISQLRHIFITHMHGDHIFGLPSILLSALHSRSQINAGVSESPDHSSAYNAYNEPITVYGPPGIRVFLRAALGATAPNFRDGCHLRIVELALPDDPQYAKRFKRHSAHWNVHIRPLPFEAADLKLARPINSGDQGTNMPSACTYNLLQLDDTNSQSKHHHSQLGTDRLEVPGGDETRGTNSVESRVLSHVVDATASASVQAAFVCHTVPSIAYVITEDVRGIRFDKQKLAACGFAEDAHSEYADIFRKLIQGETISFNGKLICPADVLRPRVPRRVCIVGDTSDASGVAHLAQNVDVLVHEATVCAAQSHIARRRGHSSSLTAANFANRIGAKKLIMNHSSVGYNAQQIRHIEAEARAVLGYDRAFVAHDFSVFNVPRADKEVGESPVFRAFLGHPRCEPFETAEVSASIDLKWSEGNSGPVPSVGVQRQEPLGNDSPEEHSQSSVLNAQTIPSEMTQQFDDEDTTGWVIQGADILDVQPSSIVKMSCSPASGQLIGFRKVVDCTVPSARGSTTV